MMMIVKKRGRRRNWKKKVISTEKFPNNPAVNYTYAFFNEVKKNSPLAQAHAEKQKKKVDNETDKHS